MCLRRGDRGAKANCDATYLVDQRSLANRVEREEKREQEGEEESAEVKALKKDPTLPVSFFIFYISL